MGVKGKEEQDESERGPIGAPSHSAEISIRVLIPHAVGRIDGEDAFEGGRTRKWLSMKSAFFNAYSLSIIWHCERGRLLNRNLHSGRYR
jgi:hypothetical protein